MSLHKRCASTHVPTGILALVNEFQSADQRVKPLQQFCFRKICRLCQPLLVFEQLHEEKPRAEELRMTARSDAFAQIAATGMKALERDVGINDDAIGVHRSDGGMNLSLLAAHHSALI